MAKLSFLEQKDVEAALEMGNGYVLDFSNSTFSDFVAKSIRIDIYDEKYSNRGASKANHLRDFFDKAPDSLAGTLLYDLIIYAKARAENSFDFSSSSPESRRFERCLIIAENLKNNLPIENVEALKPNSDEEDFAILVQSLRSSIESNQPQAALDRLHTFCMKFFRNLCAKHNIPILRDDPLGNLVGKYVKHLESIRIIQANVTLKIMKSSISIFSDFNHVRNNQSFAHDNPILNHEESVLIFNHAANTIRFINDIEKTPQKPDETVLNDFDNQIPF